MTHLLPFIGNDYPTMGVELELQLINLHSFNLAIEANDFLRRLTEQSHQNQIKPEITQAMIEINSSIHEHHQSLVTELKDFSKLIIKEAKQTHIGVCGGGTHPFQKWKSQRIFSNERFASISEQYGYLAKQFTVFGQHVHIACPSGDDALYICHALAYYVPQFIALSASSPFNQGVDTSFDCSRLGVISAFPLSGTPPWILTWEDFGTYHDKLYDLGIIHSMKDFYWDIRPKPEFGTIEVRICDTPLTTQRAADIAAYIQTLVSYLLDKRPEIHRELYYTYLINRFRAARYGFEAQIIDLNQEKPIPLTESILDTCEKINMYTSALRSEQALERIAEAATKQRNGSTWLRKKFNEYGSLEDVVRLQTRLWMR